MSDKIRYKALKDGRFSIYTDTYNPTTKKRQYNFLGLYTSRNYSKQTNIAEEDKPILEEAERRIKVSAYTNDAKKILSYLKINYEGSKQLSPLIINLSDYIRHFDLSSNTGSVEWVDRFKNFLVQKGYTEGTLKTYLYNLQKIAKMAIKEGIIKTDPFKQVKIEPIRRKKRPYLTNHQITELEGVLFPSNHQTKDAFWISFESGIKLEYLRNLTPEQVKVNEEQVTLILTEKYKVKLNSKAADLLLRHYSITKEKIFEKLEKQSTVHRAIKMWGVNAGMGNLTFQNARDTYAHLQLHEKGKNLNDLLKDLNVKNKTRLKEYYQ